MKAGSSDATEETRPLTFADVHHPDDEACAISLRAA
jgi:hypothetical protein